MKALLLDLLSETNPSAVIINNCIELIQREQVGLKKYGVSLTDAPLTHEQTLQHLLEEQLDAANYTRKALMAVSAAHVNHAELLASVQKVLQQTELLSSPYDNIDNYYYSSGANHVREQLKAMLLAHDTARTLRALRHP